MAEQTVSAKIKTGATASVKFDFGDSLSDMVDNFTEDVITSNFKANAIIGLQAFIRRQLTLDKTEEEILELVLAWKPGIKASRASDPIGTLLKKTDNMDVTQIEDLIAQLQAKKAAVDSNVDSK